MQMSSVVGQTGFQRSYSVLTNLALQPISPRLHSVFCQYQPINSRIFCRRSKVQISSVNCQVTQHKGELFLVCVFCVDFRVSVNFFYFTTSLLVYCSFKLRLVYVNIRTYYCIINYTSKPLTKNSIYYIYLYNVNNLLVLFEN